MDTIKNILSNDVASKTTMPLYAFTNKLPSPWALMKKALPYHVVAQRVTLMSIREMVNGPVEEVQIDMMENWRKGVLSQLTNIQVVGAVTSAAVVGAFTWTDLEKLSPVADAMVRLFWYCSLVLSIGAVSVGVAQSVFLIRIGTLPKAQAYAVCRQVLSRQTSPGMWEPRWEQIFIWPAAMFLLESSLWTWIAGFVVFVGDITRTGSAMAEAKDRAIAGFAFFVLTAVVATYLFSLIYLWNVAGREFNLFP